MSAEKSGLSIFFWALSCAGLRDQKKKPLEWELQWRTMLVFQLSTKYLQVWPPPAAFGVNWEVIKCIIDSTSFSFEIFFPSGFSSMKNYDDSMSAEKSGLSIFFWPLSYTGLRDQKAPGVRVAMTHNASFWTIYETLANMAGFGSQLSWSLCMIGHYLEWH